MSFESHKDKLHSNERFMYDKIKNALLSMQESFVLVTSDTTLITRIYNYVLLDHPEIFYTSGTINYLSKKGLLFSQTQVCPEYSYTKDEVSSIVNQCQQEVARIVSIVQSLSDYDKELVIHDYLCKSIKYENLGDESHNIIGALIYKKAVCEGVAKTAKYIFDQVGLESFIVEGKAENPKSKISENHAWNVVKINRSFYHLDITFDITLSDGKATRYDYFNLSDKEIKEEHYFIPPLQITCDKSDLSYYHVNNLIMTTQKDFENYLLKSIQAGLKHIVFKIPNAADKTKVASKVSSNVEKVLKSTGGNFKSYNINYNMEQLVFEVRLI